MNNIYKFFRRGIMLTAVGLAVRTVSMLFGAFVSRTVGGEGVGLYTLIMTVYSFAVTFATSGVSLTVTRLVAEAMGEGRAERIPKILRSASLYALSFGLCAALALYFGAEFFGGSVLSDGRTVASLKVLALSLVPIAVGSVLTGYFIGVKRVGFNALTQVLGQLIKIILTVKALERAASSGTVAAVFALCLASSSAEIIIFIAVVIEFFVDRLRHGTRGQSSSRGEGKNVLGMALPLALSAYVRSALLNVEHILIPKKLRERGEERDEAYTHYGILHGMALPLILYPMSPLSSFAGLLVPEFAEEGKSSGGARSVRIASLAINSTLAYSVVVAVFLFVFSEELGYIVYDSYDAGYYVRIFSFVVPIMYLDHVTDSMLKGLGEQVFSMIVNITDSCLSVLLVLLLIPRMGIMGYALVIVIMEGYNFILSVTRLIKRVKFKLDPRAVLVPFAASFSSAALTRTLFGIGGSTAGGVLIALKLIFAASLTVAALALLTALGKKKSALRENSKKRV